MHSGRGMDPCSGRSIQDGAVGLRLSRSRVPAPSAISRPTAMRRPCHATVREVFQGWRILTLLATCNTLGAELEQVKFQGKPKSIWHLKADLQEVAREELGLRPDQSEKLMVLEIREGSTANQSRRWPIRWPSCSSASAA